MAEHDADPPKNPRDLLGELQRIKDMLERGEQPPGAGNGDAGLPDIPLLNDVVSDGDELLDIDEIFEQPAPSQTGEQPPVPSGGEADQTPAATEEDGDPTLDLNHLDDLDIDFPSFTLDTHSEDSAAMAAAAVSEAEPVDEAAPVDAGTNGDLWPESLAGEAAGDLDEDTPPPEPTTDEAPPADAAAESAVDAPASPPPPSRQQLIDALVAEFLPQIEAELRRQLQQVDIEELTRHRDE